MKRFSTYIVNCRVQGIDIPLAPRVFLVPRFGRFVAAIAGNAIRSGRRRRCVRARYIPYVALLVALLGCWMQATAHSTSTENAAAWALARSNPQGLVRQAVKNELAKSGDASLPVRFRVRKITRDTDTTKEIVQTTDGGVARLVAIKGRPLSPSAEQKEIERLHALAADPSIQAHRRKSEMKDAERVRKFTRLLPQAFLYRYAGGIQTRNGTLIRLRFSPNPKFSPPDFASRVVTGIHGEVWIDPEDVRIVRIDSQFFRKVDFGWGILGVLYPGGTMQLEQSKTPKCGWRLTRLSLHLTGRELLFKSVDISIEETIGGYEPVPRGWSYRDAVRWLLQTSFSAAGG